MKKNLLYAQSGGVTPVINATACGVIEQAREYKDTIGKVYAGKDGIIGILKEAAGGLKVADVIRKHGISEQTIYLWRKRFGKLEAVDVKRLRQLEQENAKLKKLLAETMLDNAVLKDLNSKKW